jgi:hypothetical protein
VGKLRRRHQSTFRPTSPRANPLGELSHLCCTGSINKYQEAFLNILPPLSIDVESHNPTTLEDVVVLARAYEHRITPPKDTTRGLSRPRAAARSAS